MASREEALRIAQGDIGKGENPPGSNKTEFAAISQHLNGYAWCATWVVSVMRRAGIKLPSESAWTVAMNNALQATGAGVNVATGMQPGDIVFFDFVSPFNSRGIQHVGIFEKYLDGGYAQTIEGNTSAGDSGSQDNGDGVYRRKRPLKYIVAAGRPAYTPGAVAPPTPIVYPDPTRPEYDPPLSLVIESGVAAPNGGAWLVNTDGAVFAFGEAPYYGGANGQPYFAGRKAKRIDATADGGYDIVSEGDERYHYGPGGAVTVQGPEFNPALTLTIVADLKAPTGGVWLLGSDGAIFTFGNAAYKGAVNGKDYWGSRRAARLEADGDGYKIVSTSGEVYGPVF